MGDKVISFSATDVDNDTVTSSVTARHGTATINEDGKIVFTPDEGYAGPALVTLTVDDGKWWSSFKFICSTSK